MWYKDHLCLAIGKHKAAYKQLLDNTNLEICAANERGEWLRVQGNANFDNSPEALAAAFQVMPQLADMYNEGERAQAGHRLPGPPFGQAVLDVRRGQGYHELLIACRLPTVSLHAPDFSGAFFSGGFAGRLRKKCAGFGQQRSFLAVRHIFCVVQ